MSGNNNLQKGLRLTKPKGRATVSDNRPEGFFEVECLPSNLFLSAQQFQSNSRFNGNFRQIVFLPCMSQGFFVEVLQGEVVYFWGNFAIYFTKSKQMFNNLLKIA